MRITIYCSNRNIYNEISRLFINSEKIFRYGDSPYLNVAFFPSLDGNAFFVCDKIVPVYEKSKIIFYDNNFPSAGRAALKIANPNVVPFIFNSVEELEVMLKDANYL